MKRRPAGLAAVVLLGASCSSSFGMPRGGTEQGEDIFGLWQVFFWAGIGVAAIVYGLIGWSLIRYRRRRHDDETQLGRQFHANVPLEIVYTAIPVVIVIVLFALSYRTETTASSVSPTPDETLRSRGILVGLAFRLSGSRRGSRERTQRRGCAGPQIVLPLGQTTRIVLTSNDVIHAFWVPDFLYKRDALPGRTNRFDVTPTELGIYHGVCSEFCGLHHAFMTLHRAGGRAGRIRSVDKGNRAASLPPSRESHEHRRSNARPRHHRPPIGRAARSSSG